MSKPPLTMTSSQTIGPFWHLLGETGDADLTRLGGPGAQTGARIELAGRVTDGDGAPVTDACIELWQATPAASPSFLGWGRCPTDLHGEFRFVTLAPDAAAPYFAIAVFARGLLRPLLTRVYLADVADPLLAALPPARKATLLAQPAGATTGAWRWDIRMQGEGETVFLDF
jgi:protocatechuate 3,4-dioxygenase alpha subunit